MITAHFDLILLEITENLADFAEDLTL